MGFLSSLPMIYQTMKFKGHAKELTEIDVISKLAALENAGYYWDATSGKLKTAFGRHQWVHQTPWIHQCHGTSKRCGLDHQICFNMFRIIPPKCLECWKTVVGPRTFKELVALRELQKDQDVPSKCGIEVRDYTPKHYGGYYYSDSFDEGRDRYEQVRKDVDEHIGKDVPVLLKRGCTEYEFVVGPASLWHMTPEQEKTLEMIEHYVDHDTINLPQNKLVQNYVFLKWMLWAHANGDMTYKEWNGDTAFFPDYQTFHEGDRETVKQELALAKAHVLNGMDGKDANEMLNDVFNMANEKGFDPNALLNMGDNKQNVLQFKPQALDEIPDETKGDHDEFA